jgi:hypothetical protein
MMTRSWLYQISVQGRISERWSHWFEDMHACIQPGAGPETTTLTAVVVDQAALLGILQKLYTLGLPLLLVCREEAGGLASTPDET